MKLYAIVREYPYIKPMIFCSEDIAEIFPCHDSAFAITLMDGRDFFCEQISYLPDLLSLDFTDVEVTTSSRNLYEQKGFMEGLLKLRNS